MVLLTRTRRASFAGAAVALIAACHEAGNPTSLPPATLSNPAHTAAQLGTVDSALQTPAFRSFRALSAKFAADSGLAAAATLVELTRPDVPAAVEPPYGRGARRAAELRRALPPGSAAAPQAVIPGTALGKTFVWDAASGKYVPSDRTGAPANGVRFVLYAVDPLAQMPSTPLAEIGHADLIDKSAGGTTALQVTVVGTSGASPVTYADYTIDGTFSTASATGKAGGYITNGATRITFTMSLDASATKSTFNSTFDVSPQGTRIAFNTSVVPARADSLAVSVDFRMTTGSETVAAHGPIAVTTKPSGYAVSGTITVQVNGQDYATIATGTTGMTFQGAGGRELTADEMAVLKQLFTVPQDILGALEDAIQPIKLASRAG